MILNNFQQLPSQNLYCSKVDRQGFLTSGLVESLVTLQHPKWLQDHRPLKQNKLLFIDKKLDKAGPLLVFWDEYLSNHRKEQRPENFYYQLLLDGLLLQISLR